MSPRWQRSAITPWLGLVIAPVAWFGHHQLGSNLEYYDCRMANPGLYLLLGVVFGAVIAGSGAVSWLARGAGADAETRPESRRFASYFSAGLAGILFLGVFLQTLGAMLSPNCFR